jgi:dTMP kinase
VAKSAGLFITFEGIEASGKTTQVARLSKRLTDLNVNHICLREPGGTEAGEQIRSMLKSHITLCPRAELLLFNAARAQLVSDIIRPALDRGAVVICDRYVDSTKAYQQHGRLLWGGDVEMVCRLATDRVMPDVTILLDIPVAVGLERMKGRSLDRIESESVQFHHAVHYGFQQIALNSPSRVKVVNALYAAESVEDQVWNALLPHVARYFPKNVDPLLEEATP